MLLALRIANLSICTLWFLQCLCFEIPYVVFFPPSKDYFTVAVLEHARVGNPNRDPPEEIVSMNLGYYERATTVAKSKNADIIVFPEYGLFPYEERHKMKSYLEAVPDPNRGWWNPCRQRRMFSDRPMLLNLSCMAMKHDIVVLANTGDIEQCNLKKQVNCPEDGTFHYNANVVFSRQGTIILRYRKERLFFEIGMDLPQESQNPKFTTDFGTFASFISFDAYFKRMVDESHMNNVDGVFLCTHWVESMPFFSSVQYFQGWAIGNNVTLVVSNLHLPKEKAAVGSGVFAGSSGAVAYTFNPDGRAKLLVTKVPKTKHRIHFHDLDPSITIITSNGSEPYKEHDINFGDHLPEYCSLEPSVANEHKCVFENTENYTLVKLTEPNGEVGACNNGMCCTLKYSTLGMFESFYLGVTNFSYNVYDRYIWCEEKCLVARCEESEGKKCSVFPIKSSTVFLKLELNANFTTPFVYPSIVRNGMRIAPPSDWNYYVRDVGDHYAGQISFINTSPRKKMLIAALHGRCYDRDPPYIR